MLSFNLPYHAAVFDSCTQTVRSVREAHSKDAEEIALIKARLKEEEVSTSSNVLRSTTNVATRFHLTDSQQFFQEGDT